MSSVIGTGRCIAATPKALHDAIVGCDPTGFRRRQVGWITDVFTSARDACLDQGLCLETAERIAYTATARVVTQKANQQEVEAEQQPRISTWATMSGDVSRLLSIAAAISALTRAEEVAA